MLIIKARYSESRNAVNLLIRRLWLKDDEVEVKRRKPEITVTGQKVKLKLGVSPVDSLLLTTERTSALTFIHKYYWEWGIGYILAKADISTPATI